MRWVEGAGRIMNKILRMGGMRERINETDNENNVGF